MGAGFEEIDRRATPMGVISLRRRLEPSLLVDVYEVKLDDEYLMSSLFTGSEVALARLGLAAVPGTELDVVVGGLGLGYTARTVLEDPRVRSLHVVETLAEVIGWHEDGLLPLGDTPLTEDPRCHLVHGDFFALASGEGPFGSAAPECVDAVLLDIDHTPQHILHPSHAAFYERAGLRRLARHLHPEGVFGLWSDAADPAFEATVGDVFAACVPHVVSFPTPYDDGDSTSVVYVATGPPGAQDSRR